MKLASKRLVQKTAAAPSFLLAAAMLPGMSEPALAWQPTQTITITVPAGAGGGADKMARLIAAIVAKHKLAAQPVEVVNQPEGGGTKAFLKVKAARQDAHNLVITLSNIFTAPMASGVAFAWRDLVPVSVLALDQFVLWVPADQPWQTPREFLDAVAKAPDNRFKLGGTGSRQEDELLTVALNRYAAPRQLVYVPLPGGGAVAGKLVKRELDASVNNPIEGLKGWREGKLRPLCIFARARSSHREPVAQGKAWSDIPTCRESGLEIDYEMLRGIFMAPGVDAAQVAYYTGLLKRVTATAEWQSLVSRGALDGTVLTGQVLMEKLQRADDQHYVMMRMAGFLAPSKFRFFRPRPPAPAAAN